LGPLSQLQGGRPWPPTSELPDGGGAGGLEGEHRFGGNRSRIPVSQQYGTCARSSARGSANRSAFSAARDTADGSARSGRSRHDGYGLTGRPRFFMDHSRSRLRNNRLARSGLNPWRRSLSPRGRLRNRSVHHGRRKSLGRHVTLSRQIGVRGDRRIWRLLDNRDRMHSRRRRAWLANPAGHRDHRQHRESCYCQFFSHIELLSLDTHFDGGFRIRVTRS
jgi:hypothetical protein